MRPRHKTAENKTRSARSCKRSPCFNEAAAQNRGKRAPGRADARRVRGCFNEAAAQNRGKREYLDRVITPENALQ